jgi:hypothetical protein
VYELGGYQTTTIKVEQAVDQPTHRLPPCAGSRLID